MSDEPSPVASVPGEQHCPWCSAPLASTTEARCPSCGATVQEEEAAAEIPGVTRIDPEAILRARSQAAKSRGLIGWLAGDYVEEGPRPAPGTLAPPPDDVKREILRLELAALEAEVRARLGEIELETDSSGAGPSATEPSGTDADLPQAPEDPGAEADTTQTRPTTPSA